MSAFKLRRVPLGITIALGSSILAVAPVMAQTSPSPYTSATRYDVLGRVTGTIVPDPDGTGPIKFAAVRNTYDNWGRLTKVETGELSAWQSEAIAPKDWTNFAVQSTVDRTYDNLGHKLSETVKGSDGVVASLTQFKYYSTGELECAAVRMNPAIFAGPPASACTLGAEGSNGPDRITRNEYYAGEPGLIKKIQKGYGTPLQQDYASYTYSSSLKVTSMTDARGFKASMSYDGHDRQKRWYFPDKALAATASTTDYEEYGYDANSNRTTLRKRDGKLIGYGYDALNRMTSKGGSYMADIAYTYDLRGLQLTAKFATGGEGVTNAYNGFGELTSGTINMLGLNKTLTHQYDANGNRTRVTHPDGPYFQMGYDGLNRMNLAHWWTAPSGLVQFMSIAFENTGQRSNLNVASSWTSYGYDPVGRLASMPFDFVGTAGDVTHTYSYNHAGQMIGHTRDNDGYAWTGAANVDRNYTVNGINQYQAAGPASFCHDANGNLTADGTSVYKYDVENRLVEKRAQVSSSCPTTDYSGTLQASLTYDPMGRLFQVTGPTTNTRFVYDGDKLALEYDSNGTIAWRYFFGPGVDEPLVADMGGALNCSNTRFLHANHQGSMVAAADCWGNRTTVATYDEYGIPGPNNWGRFQYTGQAWIPELGMYYYKARIYSPTLGRFLQTDPVGYKDQVNLYAYVGNDPVNAADPTGLDTVYRYPDGSVRIEVRVDNQSHLSDQQVAASGVNLSGVTSDLKSLIVSIQVSPTNPDVIMRNEPGLDSTSSFGSLRSHTDSIGGDTISLSPTADGNTAGHELGHHLWAGDQYKGGVDAQSKTLESSVPGPSNLMRNGNGAINAQSADEIVRGSTQDPKNRSRECNSGTAIQGPC